MKRKTNSAKSGAEPCLAKPAKPAKPGRQEPRVTLAAMPVRLAALSPGVGRTLKTAAAKSLLAYARRTSSGADAALAAADGARDAAIAELEAAPAHAAAYAAAACFVADAELLRADFAAAAADRRACAVAALRAADLALLRGGLDWAAVTHALVTHAARIKAECDADAGDSLPAKKRKKTEKTGPAPLPPQFATACALARDIPRVDARSLSVEEFTMQYMEAQPPRPVILTNVVDSWPAYTLWRDVDYLKRVAEGRLVPIETYAKEEAGKSFLSKTWSHQVIPLDEYIARFVTAAGGTVKDDDGKDIQGYLAQHPLFDQIPTLREDIITPSYCKAHTAHDDATPENCEYKHEPVVSAWFGPAGTVSPLHNDPYHNVLAQIVGSKYIRIYDAEQTDCLYPRSDRLGHNSQVDIDNPKEIATKFPLFQKAPFWQTILNEGELLYMPRHVWHYVRSLETSFSASFWFGAKTELVKTEDGTYETRYLEKHVRGIDLNIQ